MPWTDVRDFAQGARIVGSAARANAGLLIDPIHFDRGGSRASEIAGRARGLVPLRADCATRRPSARHDLDGLLHQARAERLLPGDGGLDLAASSRALPRDLPVSLEIPMERLAKTVPAPSSAHGARAGRDAQPVCNPLPVATSRCSAAAGRP